MIMAQVQQILTSCLTQATVKQNGHKSMIKYLFQILIFSTKFPNILGFYYVLASL